MPTLEDTVDFKVATLNDLLDADVRTGVPVAADDKYKRWAFLSTGLAGMLLVALIVALVTGGGDEDKGGGTTATEEFAQPANTSPVTVRAGANFDEGIVPGTPVTLYVEGKVIATGGTVLKITEATNKLGGVTRSVRVAVPNEQAGAVNAALSNGQTFTIAQGVQEAPTTTTTVAPSTTPTPIEPAPATPPPS